MIQQHVVILCTVQRKNSNIVKNQFSVVSGNIFIELPWVQQIFMSNSRTFCRPNNYPITTGPICSNLQQKKAVLYTMIKYKKAIVQNFKNQPIFWPNNFFYVSVFLSKPSCRPFLRVKSKYYDLLCILI